MKELEGLVGPLEVLEANMHVIDGQQTNLSQLRSFCDAVPFLAAFRLVRVNGLLKLFESRNPNKRRPSRKSREPLQHVPQRHASRESWDDLPTYIENKLPSSTLLIFTDQRLSKTNALLKTLTPISTVQEFHTPSGGGLSQWAMGRTKGKGGHISPGGLAVLIRFVGRDLWSLDNELEKLVLYAAGRTITEADVQMLVSQSKDASIFVAVDALLDGKSSAALKTLKTLRDKGAEFPYITTMIGRQLRLVILSRELIDGAYKPEDIGERLGINQDFAVKRTVEQARQHSPTTLAKLYKRLLAADISVKEGSMGPDLALELLATDMALIRQSQNSTD